jgi:hypothetical protein
MRYRLEAFDTLALGLFKDCKPLLDRFGKVELVNRIGARSRSDADGNMTITAPGGVSSSYICQATSRLDINALAPLTQRLRRWKSGTARRPLLIAPYINDSVGERLRAQQIAYLDAVGNACLMDDPLVSIWLRGFKSSNKTPRASLAFQTSGLHLIPLLLSDAHALDRPYRELAARAGISLGSTSRVLRDLRALGFVRLTGRGRSALTDCSKLLEQWEFAYSTRLRPRMKARVFRTANSIRIQDIPDRIPRALADRVLVGGELAAAMMTKHLRPRTVTLHIAPGQTAMAMVKELKLAADPAGDIILLEQFGEMCAWKWQQRDALVNPLFVHAELLHGAPDDRLKETAALIFSQHLRPMFNDELLTDPKRA